MKTHIKTVHEEEYSDKSRTLGVLLNYSDLDKWKDSLVYIYRDGMYIFFNTIIDMIDYLLYGENKMKRAYMDEEEFDKYYDDDFIEGTFSEKLKWT
jgi:hypothetical protein